MHQDELINDFVNEAQVQLESLDSDLLELKKNIDKLDADVLNNVFRVIHNIKVASRFYSFEKIMDLSIIMVDLIAQLRQQKIKASPGMIDTFSKSVGKLKLMLGDLGKSDQYDIKKEIDLLRKYQIDSDKPIKRVLIHEKYRSGKQRKEFEIPEEQLVLFEKNNQSLYTLKFFIKKDLTRNKKSLLDLINTINMNGEIIESVLDVDGIQGLSDCLDSDLPFIILFATAMKPTVICDDLDIPQDRITAIDIPEKNTLYLMPETDLVASKIEELRDFFLERLKANPSVKKVILRADNIETIDSLGVNLIIGIYRQAHSESKTFEITGAGEKFLKVANFFQFPALFSINSDAIEKNI